MNEENRIENIFRFLISAKEKGEINCDEIYKSVSQFIVDDREKIFKNIFKYLNDYNIKIIEEKYENNSFSKTRNDYISDYYNEISCYELLSFEQECELSKLIIIANELKSKFNNQVLNDEQMEIITKGNDAKESLVNHNLRLVVHIAKKYNTNDVELFDLIQEGNMGLIKAAEKYDYRLGYRFSTYAYYWIKQAINKELKNSQYIKIPEYLYNEAAVVKRKFNELSNIYGVNATAEQIANELGGKYSIERIKELLTLSFEFFSLDQAVDEGNNSRTLHETTISNYHLNNSNEFMDFPDGWNKLSDKEKDILILFERDKMTLAKIGLKYNVSAGRIRQIKDRAKKKLDFYRKQNN